MYLFLIVLLHLSVFVSSQGLPQPDPKKLDTNDIHVRCEPLKIINDETRRGSPPNQQRPNRAYSDAGSEDTIIVTPQMRQGTPETVNLRLPGEPVTPRTPGGPWTQGSPGSPTLRSPRRRSPIPEPPKPYLFGKCRGRDTAIALDSCLGWDPRNGGTIIAQKNGQGMTKGDCHSCQYYKTGDDGSFLITCLCQKTPQAEQISGMDDPRLRMFHQPGVIVIDKNNRFRCFDILGL